MFRITRAQVLPIGLDIGHDTVRLMQLEVIGAQQLKVLAAARHPLPEEARRDPQLRLPTAMDIVRRLLRSGEFSGKQLVTAMPRESVHIKNLRLPPMPAAELAQAVDFEARNVFLFGSDEVDVRFLHAGEVRQGNDLRQEVIVLAARREDTHGYLEQLHRAGAIVESLDFEPSAIYRSVERFIRRREDEQEVHVLVDIGGRRSQVIVGRGRDISFYKPVDIGAWHLHEAVARKLGVSIDEAAALRRRLLDHADANNAAARRDPVRQAVFDSTRSVLEDLSREISLCLRYHSVTFRGHRPSRLRLTGGDAGDAQLQSVLNANLPIPVEALQPLRNVDTSRMKPADRRGHMAEWTAAFGLALKKTTGHFANRDGPARDPDAPREVTSTRGAASSTGTAEVIDLQQAVHAAEVAASNAPATSHKNSSAATQEVVHA